MKFDENNIIRLFGNEAAENEDINLLEKYYLKGALYNQVKSNNPLYIVVGHKGTGKSALLKMLSLEESKTGFAIELQKEDFDYGDLKEQSYKFYKENLIQLVFNKLIGIVKCNNAQIQNQNPAFINWLGQFSEGLKEVVGKSYAEIKNENYMISFENFCTLTKIGVFESKPITELIDDLDLEWKDTQIERNNMSAFINAVRRIISSLSNVKFRISMRTSVYYSVRMSDESTDKFESSVVWLSWTNDEIFSMLVKRVLAFEGKEILCESIEVLSQAERLKLINNVFEERFNGKGYWNNVLMYRVLMSLVRKRPRDLIKLCLLASRKAEINKHNKINTKDLESIFGEYSHGRMQDTINEYRSELSNIEEVLYKMKPSVVEKRKCIYKFPELLQKLKYIIDQCSCKFFTNGQKLEPKNLATFLYKINFMTARKDTDQGIQRLYFDEHQYAINNFTDFGFDMEIHPAYRWALQPDSMQDLYNQIELANVL